MNIYIHIDIHIRRSYINIEDKGYITQDAGEFVSDNQTYQALVLEQYQIIHGPGATGTGINADIYITLSAGQKYYIKVVDANHSIVDYTLLYTHY